MQLNLYPMTFKVLGALSEAITIIRRPTSVSQQGLNVITQQTFTATAYITASAPDALQREPDYSLTERAIEVYTNFPLQATRTGYQPDEIIWHGGTLVVFSVEDYSKLGAGYIKAICRSQKQEDPATMLP